MLLAAELLRVCCFPARFSPSISNTYASVYARNSINSVQSRTFSHVLPLKDAASTPTKSPRRGRPPKAHKADNTTPETAVKKKRGRKNAIDISEDPFSDEGTSLLI